MVENNALLKLTHGMYVLTTNGAACFVDAVCQISSGDNPLVSIAVNKKNFTNEVLHHQDRYALSIVGEKDNMDLVKNFGFQSMRDHDKFASSPNKVEMIQGVPVVKDTLAYLVLEKVDTIENDTHTLFIGRVIEAKQTKQDRPMSYNYYQEHKDELMKVTTTQGKTAWVCTICGYVYYGETLPEGFTCPVCGVGPELFEKKQG
jgi:flavin reductase (DIM6/NTAB) family NADH-FMN oxidoreductase RutF/rubredoxin